MARYVLIALAITVIFAAAGCVRLPFDLCESADAHPDCPADGGQRDAAVTDAGMDSGG